MPRRQRLGWPALLLGLLLLIGLRPRSNDPNESVGIDMSQPKAPTKQDRNLNHLHPLFRPKLEQWLAAARKAGFRVLVYETFRTKERQEWLYAQGRTRAQLDAVGLRHVQPRPGPIVTKTLDSAHEYGVAADVVPLKPDGSPDWKGYAALYKAAPPERYGLERLSWEQPHLQLAGVNGPNQDRPVAEWAKKHGIQANVIVGSTYA